MSRLRRKVDSAKASVVRIPRSSAVPVSNGHPWVFRDMKLDLPVGTPVVLTNNEGGKVAWGLADDGPIAVRVLGRVIPKHLDVPALLMDRVHRADRLRTRLMPPSTNAYRIVNGAGDGLPGLVIDRYDSLAIVRVYAAAWEPWLDEVVAAITRLGWAEQVARRLGVKRVDDAQGLEPLKGGDPAELMVVEEHGMLLYVRPWDGQKTGLFLDHREHRRMVGQWAAGRQVANLFAYNGGFSVAAALGGASRVVTVDVAPEAVEDARMNFELNGLDPKDYAFEVADVFSWEPTSPVDLLVVDPPSLARGRKNHTAARRAYRKLHARLGPFIPRDGLMATASCTSWLDRETWSTVVEEGLRSGGDWSWLWRSDAPPDHPVAMGHGEGHYLKFGLLRRR